MFLPPTLAHGLFEDRGSPQFYTSLSSTHQIHTKGLLLFSPKNPSVPHQKPLSSTHPSVPHQKPLSSTPSVPHQKLLSSTHPLVPHQKLRCGTEGFSVWNWGEGRTEGFLVWNWGILVFNWGISGAETVWSLCGTNVLNWVGLCGSEGYSKTIVDHFLTPLAWELKIRAHDEICGCVRKRKIRWLQMTVSFLFVFEKIYLTLKIATVVETKKYSNILFGVW